MTVDRGAAGELVFSSSWILVVALATRCTSCPCRGGIGGEADGQCPQHRTAAARLSTPPRPHYCARKQLAGKRLQNCEVCSIYMTTIYGPHSVWPPTLGYVNNLVISWLNMVLSYFGDSSRNLEVDSLAVALEEQTVVFSQ